MSPGKGDREDDKMLDFNELDAAELVSALRHADQLLWAAKKMGGDQDLLWSMHAYLAEQRAEVSR
jgi:hypothetical protein